MTSPAETTKIELELREEIARLRTLLPERIDLDPADLERGLAGLVLTLVEFLRQVLERQAIRRMEGGTLTDDEVERVGLALMRLQEKIREIAGQFGLDEDDIQLRIGAAS
jgi:Gas vesicle protein K